MFESFKRAFGSGTRPHGWSVDISENGREGSVVYHDHEGSLTFYWEFGGGDVLATIGVGTGAEWSRKHPWAAARRTEILQRVASELIRQKAPTSRAEIDDLRGFINLR